MIFQGVLRFCSDDKIGQILVVVCHKHFFAASPESTGASERSIELKKILPDTTQTPIQTTSLWG